jgi:hypothetical protein
VGTCRLISQRAEDVVENPFFSGAVNLSDTMLSQRESLPHTGTARRKCTSGVCGLVREAYMSCVSGFHCRVYIDLNHRDSRISVTTCLWLSARR